MDYQQIAHNYMTSEDGQLWKEVFTDPAKADGLCTDSAESFVKWCEKEGIEAYALDLVSHENNMGLHTVAIMEDGKTIIDFTMHQFFPDDPQEYLAPYIAKTFEYAAFGWGVDGREAYSIDPSRQVPQEIIQMQMGYIPPEKELEIGQEFKQRQLERQQRATDGYEL